MPRIFASLAACGLLLCAASTWAAEAVTRFLIVGDSWAEEQWTDGSHGRVFKSLGLSNVAVSGELTTTSGSTAADWVMSANLDRISQAFAQYPHLDTVQLTIGGNDFLDAWNTSLTPEQFDALMGFIQHDVTIVANHILGLRPDVEIVLSLYDYPNFEDTRNGLIWTFACSPLWNDLGQPSPLALNSAAVAVIDAIEAELTGNPRISHVRHLGQAQNFFGLPGHPPGTMPPPGLLDLPSPAAAMRERFLLGGLDCFHFNAGAYDLLVGNLVAGYLEDRFQTGLSLTLLDQARVYNGQPHPAEIAAEPPVEGLILSYSGNSSPPINAGVYELVVTAPGWREALITSYEVAQASQAISFLPPETLPLSETGLELEAGASSGLPVLLELLSGPASLEGSTLVLDGSPGVVVIRASQGGDGNWLPAESLEREILIFEASDELFRDRFEPLAIVIQTGLTPILPSAGRPGPAAAAVRGPGR